LFSKKKTEYNSVENELILLFILFRITERKKPLNRYLPKSGFTNLTGPPTSEIIGFYL